MATHVTPLFESFSILVLACKNNEEKPSIVYKWQFLSVNNNPDATTVEQISQFCFPDDLSFQAQFYPGVSETTQNDPKTENFAFVMTDSDGTKKIGICRRRVEPLVAKCYCFISKHPYFELFERLLSALEAQQKLAVSETAFKQMLEHTLKESELPVNKQVLKKKPQNVTLNFFNNSFTTPIGHGLSEFGDISLLPLLSSLSYKNISRVFASVFSERRIIFSSSDLGKLSYAAMGVYSLMYPFAWHYIFIPVLPAPLLHYCCAPMPFVVGIHTSSLDELAKMPLEEIVFVYLDDNKVVSGFDDDLEMLPNNWGHTKSGIKQYLSSGKKSGVYDNKIVTDSFSTIFTGIFGKSKNYLVSNNGTMTMDRSGFEQSIPKGFTKFFSVFKESQIFEQYVRGLQENRPNLHAFDELCVAYEKKQQSLLEASQNQETLGSFLDDNLKSLWDTGKSSILNLFSNKESKKAETKVTKEEKQQQQPISVHSAIKNILEQQYKNRDTMHLPPRQHRANTIHNTVELATAFESGEDKSAGLLMGKVAIEELRKRLSTVHRQSMMINPNQISNHNQISNSQHISSNPNKVPIKKDYSLPEIPKKTYFQAKAERNKQTKTKIHVDTLDTPKPKPNVDVIGLEPIKPPKQHSVLSSAKSFIDFGSKPKPLPATPPPLSSSLDSVKPIPPRLLEVNKRGSLPEEPAEKPQRSFMRPLPITPREEPEFKKPIQKSNSSRPLPRPQPKDTNTFTLRTAPKNNVPQSQNRSRATIAPEMDEHAHMTDAHISRFPTSRDVPIEKSNTKKLMMKLQLQMDSKPKPKESVSAPTTPTNAKTEGNAELMQKLQRRRELGDDS